MRSAKARRVPAAGTISEKPSSLHQHARQVAVRVERDDAVGEAARDGALADAGRAHQAGAVGAQLGEHVEGVLDSAVAPDHGVELPLGGGQREVGARRGEGGEAGAIEDELRRKDWVGRGRRRCGARRCRRRRCDDWRCALGEATVRDAGDGEAGDVMLGEDVRDGDWRRRRGGRRCDARRRQRDWDGDGAGRRGKTRHRRSGRHDGERDARPAAGGGVDAGGGSGGRGRRARGVGGSSARARARDVAGTTRLGRSRVGRSRTSWIGVRAVISPSPRRTSSLPPSDNGLRVATRPRATCMAAVRRRERSTPACTSARCAAAPRSESRASIRWREGGLGGGGLRGGGAAGRARGTATAPGGSAALAADDGAVGAGRGVARVPEAAARDFAGGGEQAADGVGARRRRRRGSP